MEDLPRPRYGRRPLDPGGKRATKVNGVWLAPHDHQSYLAAIESLVAHRKVTVAHARRVLLMSGVRAEMASLKALEEMRPE